MSSHTPSTEPNGGMSAVLWKAVIRFFLLMVLMFAVLFLAAGRIDWWEAWAYVIQGLIIMIVQPGDPDRQKPGYCSGAR